ncbi:hypothetical protein MM300_17635 [Evansella sp. LMS18]|uniref:hypothetical protein n=1 Tax=Evansella sp. LMS18 TaxID=2924033 RepID=UPI0020D04EEE|nr:hypothetical protein [Evansella sp. LMS18]UTR09697.1 hypothetical protein MM300_17635 [Evansella sp. LMS18]
MNRKKGYRLLALFLFIAFISLISRSLIYLVLSTVVAVSIILLLSADRKNRRDAGNLRIQEEDKVSERGLSGAFVPALFLITGIIMATYGMSGLTGRFSLLSESGIMADVPAVLIFSVVIGCLLAVYGIYNILKYSLKDR